eukprot:Nitzschia sp. Nitz4//scaffold71_size96697//11327//12409//NITZ4_004686-RA/size96697-processed-gene-0.24-mRNA-1//-1//CDS//3329557220//754//frame0
MNVLGAPRVHGDYNVLEQISDLPVPEIQKPQDVLIRVFYSDVNPVDLQKLRGRDSSPTPVRDPPFVPGYGGSGIVIETGSEAPSDWKEKSVCFLADPSRQGSYATHILVDYRSVARLPANVDMRTAASVPIAGLTAFESLMKVGWGPGLDNQAGDTTRRLLLVGGAGGVGSWVLTLAKAWHPKWEVIATASSELQKQWCKSLGAKQVLNHADVGKELQGGRDGSVDAVICLTEPDPTTFDACAEVIKPYGNICLVVAGKSVQSLNLGFCFFKCVNVVLETVFSSIRSDYKVISPSDELSSILELLSKGEIRAPLSPDLETPTLSEAIADATKENGVLRLLGQPHGRRGKLILKLPPPSLP